jgi:hypothetical protein
MFNVIKAAATGLAFTAALIGTGGLVLIAMLAWQAFNNPFFDA